ncbi:MAG: histidine kinase, partial [Magnetospirillum sp.]
MDRLPRPRFLLAVITAITLIGGGIGLIGTIWSDHNATLVDWTANLSLSARLVESHMRGLHTQAHANLLRIEDRLSGRPLADLRDSERDRAWLDTLLAGIPGGFAICIHDDKANPVLTTDRRTVFARNAAGHEYMTLALAQPGKTVVSAMTTDRTAPGNVIILSRALIDRGGQVRGVAEILVDADAFSGFYRPLQAPDRGSIFTIMRTDGRSE